MRRINHLYIIGNGFDLYHGLPTSYGHFREYVKELYSELTGLVEKYYLNKKDSVFLSEFMENLGNFDDDLLREHGMNYLNNYGCDNWRDAFHHDYHNSLMVYGSRLMKEINQRIKTLYRYGKRNGKDYR